MKKNDDESSEHTVASRMGWWSRNQNGEKLFAVLAGGAALYLSQPQEPVVGEQRWVSNGDGAVVEEQ